MQIDALNVQAQPFIKLAQSNMELLTRFSTSPEVSAQATASAGQLFQQASASAMNLMNSGAFAQLMQGMLKNYTTFVSEVGQGGMAMWSAGQSELIRQTQEAAATAIDGTTARRRR